MWFRDENSLRIGLQFKDVQFRGGIQFRNKDLF